MAQTSTSRVTISIATVLALILTLAGQIGPSALPAAAAGPDPTKIPHYFGPWPNWANSPLTTPDVAVAFTGGGGSGAQATATVGADGAVTELTLTDPGGGYTSAPTVEFISEGTGDGAMATATVATSGSVTGVTIDSAGAGYTAPTVSFSGGEGAGTPVRVGNPLQDRAYATDFPNTAAPLPALVVMPNSVLPAGTLTEFLSWNQASTGGSDSPSAGKTFTAYVLRPTVTNQYTVVYASDLKTVPPLPGDGTVSEQVAYPVNPGVAVQAGDVLAFYGSGIPTDTGVGTDILSYTAPTAPIQGGTVELGSAGYPVVPENRRYSFAATVLDPSLPVTPLKPASATVYGGIDAIALPDPGAGYTFPTVSIDFPDAPDGVQATAHVVCVETNCDNGGAPVTIDSIFVDNAGSGYSTAPGIAILNGTQFDPINLADGGSAATATSTLKISSIVVDDPGDGYATAPTVSITDATGSGAGATATATVNTGSITGLTLDAPGSGYVTPGIKKFEDQLPVTCTPPACPTGANDKYIPVGVPTVASYPDDEGTPIEADVYEIGLVQYRTKFHKDLPPTLVRGYVQLMTPALEAQGFSGVPLSNALKDGVGSAPIAGYRGVTPPQYLGPFIAATKDRPVRIVFRNLLPTGAEGDLFLPVDSTMMGSGKFGMDHGLTGTGEVLDEVRDPECGKAPKGLDCFKDNRATLHLHGGITPWISDGTPHQWITPADEVTGYPQGVSVREVPDMSGCEAADDGCQTFFYTNQQSARLMFYHDHAWGITRLNVYAGEAAGYMITDAMEQKLIDDRTIPADQIPLIVQDRTFVPGPDQLAAQDPTWDTDRWGGEGNFWYHHVYMPAQNPGDPSGMSAYGRWMYGPWFWPPATGTVYGPIKNPYYDPACNIDDPATWTYDTDPYCEPEQIPGTPNISAGMEQFNDTPVVNGVAYPTTTVDPKSYRLRVLNAANDRFFNFQWYIADPDVKNGGGKSEVKLKKAELDAAQLDPVVFPTPDTVGGTLDGPDWVQIGTEGGFLPKPVVVNGQQETTWITDATRFDVGNVDKHSLLLAPAERADAIVDFSKFAGKTLILYNDAPAAFPARIPSYDYYTGAPDLSPVGAPKILPGYGPNTRTIMRVEVRPATEVTPDAPFNMTKLNNAFKHNAKGTGVFESSQHPIIVGQQPYNSAYGTNFAAASNCNAPDSSLTRCDGYVRVNDTANLSFNTLAAPNSKKTIKLEPKAIHDEMNSSTFDDFGRMQANLGIEASPPTPGLQNVTLYPFMNPATEMIDATKLPEIDVTYANGEAASNVDITPIGLADDGSQIWRVTHNGVDTHPIHFHLYDVQVLNRVTWDNIIKPPDPEELGWKDTVRMAPLEDTIVALRPIIPELPWEIPNSVRLLNPMMDAGSTEMFNNISPQGVPTAPIVNKLVNFGWEYVFHCHILSHEEMDMMRPVTVAYPPRTPDGVLLSTQGGGAKVTWNDNSIAETAYLVQRKKRAGEGWDTVTTVPSPLNAANGKGVRTYVDGAGLTTDTYRVVAENTVGYGAEFPEMTVTSTSEEAVFALTKPTNVAGTVTGAGEITVTWDPSVADGVPAVTGYEVLKAPSTGTPWTVAGSVADPSTSLVVGGLAKGTSWIFQVRAVNPDPGPWSDPSAAVAIPGTTPGAPTGLAGTTGPGAGEVSLTWTAPVDNGGTPITGYEVESSPATGAPIWTAAGSVTGTGTSLLVTGLPNGSELIFQVRAVNGTGPSAWSGPSAAVTTLPGAPTGVGGTSTPGSTSVSLSWTAPAGAAPITGFEVQKSPAGGPVDWTVVGSVTGSGTSLVGTGLLKGTSWIFRVRAENAGGKGAWSVPSAAVTIPATVPGPVTGLSGVAGPSSVALSWGAPGDTGGLPILGYKVLRSEDDGATWTVVTYSTGSTDTTYTVIGLASTSSYRFRVEARNQVGPGGGPMTTAITPLPSAPPGAPSGVSAVAGPGGGRATVSWSVPADSGGTPITGYVVQKSLASGTPVWTVAGWVPGSGSTSMLVSGLVKGESWVFRVAAENWGGPGAWSDPSAAVTIPATVPGPVTGLSGVAGPSSVALSWGAPGDTGGLPILGYKVLRSEDDGATWTVVTYSTGSTDTTYTVIGLASTSSYRFRVEARNQVGPGGGPMTTAITPLPSAPPGAPSGVSAVAGPGGGRATVSWSVPADSGGTPITGYVVQKSLASGTPVWTVAGWVPGSGSTSMLVSGLVKGESWVFRVAAENWGGPGAWSDPSAAVTIPATVPGPVTGLSGVAGPSSVALSWGAPGDTGGLPILGYKVLRSEDDGATWTVVTYSTGSTDTTYTVIGLASTSSYRFRVEARNQVGPGGGPMTTAITPLPSAPPGAPSGVSAVAGPGGGRATVSWSVPADSGGTPITGYVVQKSLASGTPVWTVAGWVPGSGSTSMLVSGLAKGESWVFRVAAENWGGPGAWSVPSAAVTIPATVPGPVTGLSGVAGPSSVALSWGAPGDTGGLPILGYKVLRSEDDGATWTVVTYSTGSTDTTYTVIGLASTSSYRFRVEARNQVGPGGGPMTTAITPL